MDTPLPAAGDALAQPTRARLFALLEALKREASTEELAGRLGMHANGVRRQLEQLVEAGLVERTKSRERRGRPRDQWAIAADANPGGERPRAYTELATWLAGAMAGGPARLRQVERAGREIGGALAPAGAEDSAEAFERVLSALGFQPELEVDPEGGACCRLRNCPYKEAVRENPEVVCTLHRGITAGLLSELAPDARLVGFEPRDPDRAGCLIEVAGAGWSGDAARPRPE